LTTGLGNCVNAVCGTVLASPASDITHACKWHSQHADAQKQAMDLERCSQKITATSREVAVLKIEQDWEKDCQLVRYADKALQKFCDIRH
jgi:hypothetical protein